MNTHPFFFLDSDSPHFPTASSNGQIFDTAPLSFDRVYRGHVTSSAFPLFKVPVELFAHVTRYLSTKDLKALALVDRDCYKLAALSQYKTLQIEPNSTIFYPETPSLHVPPSRLADCVRQLNVTLPSSIQCSSIPNLGTDNDIFPEDDHIPSGYKVVTSFFSNIYILNWDGPSFISSDIKHCLWTSSSSIRHLRLRGTLLDPSNTDIALKENVSFPLETLSLDIDWATRNGSQQNVSFITDLFHAVAPHLKQLVWKGHQTQDNAVYNINIPMFPNLRSLVLDSLYSNNEHVLPLFLGDNTRIRSLSVDMSSSTRDFLRSRGRVSSMRHLSSIYRLWSHFYYTEFLTFLSHNDQLETVHIAYPIHHADMDSQLLPMLRQHFDVLTSLRLTFDGTDIPQQSLQAISAISTLRRLWLSAGDQGFRSTWVILHDDIFKYLKSLVNLELLAFSHDTYYTNAHALAPRFVDYYTTKALPVDLDITAYLTFPENLLYEGRNVDYETGVSMQAQMREQAWERWHTECMLKLANQYSQVFPTLRWCFMGQLAFSGDKRTPFTTVDTSARREPCLTSLQKVMSIDIWRPV